MISGIHVEVLLIATYAAFLICAAFSLELLARLSHRRSSRYQSAGFIYFRGLDYWECPAGQQLTREEVDYQRRITRYRAPAAACNACSLKNNCTDSDRGRLLESRLDSWLDSEVRRFHRGLSLALLVLATILLLAAAFEYPAPRELLIVGSLLIPTVIADSKLLASFFARQNET